MPFTPIKGSVAMLKLSLAGGSTDIILPAINWSLDQDPKAQDVSNFRDGRTRAATLDDAIISTTVVWDNADRPTKTTTNAIRTGALGQVKLLTGPGTNDFYLIPIMVTKIGTKNEGVENVLMQDVELSQTGGVLTYPADA